MRRRYAFFALPLVLILGTPAIAQDVFQVTVNTSSIDGQNGNIDFQFNPGLGADPANVVISGFSTDGTLLPTSPLNGTSGDVSGLLPGNLTFDNATAFNDYFEGITFGNTATFTATLSGPAIASPSGSSGGSTFAFSLYDSTGSIPLLTADPNGSVADIDINPDGSTSTQTFASDANGSPSVATITALTSATPEPSALDVLLFGAAILGLTGLRAARRKPS